MVTYNNRNINEKFAFFTLCSRRSIAHIISCGDKLIHEPKRSIYSRDINHSMQLVRSQHYEGNIVINIVKIWEISHEILHMNINSDVNHGIQSKTGKREPVMLMFSKELRGHQIFVLISILNVQVSAPSSVILAVQLS